MPEYRFALTDLKKGMLAAGFVGFFVNILHLSLPLYTIQIYDRVISSGSLDTLVALTVIVVFLLGYQAVLDYLRHRIFMILGGAVATRLGRPVFEAAVETTLRSGVSTAAGSMRDLGELRAFIASGALGLPMDLLMTPLFLLVLYLLHPLYGAIGLIGVVLLTLAAVATEILARRPAARANITAGAAGAETAAAIRNAEVITAMGMLPAVAERWHTKQADALEDMASGRAVAKALAAAAKSLRIGLQIAIVCGGATLVIDREVSAGTLIAAAVISGRLLLPFEQLIDGWRQWLKASGQLQRLRDVLASGATRRSRVPVAVKTAKLVADRVSYVPEGQNVPLLRNVSFHVGAGELLGVVGPSGAGKSTLSKLVVGLWGPTSGGIFLDGQSTYSHERGSFGEAVGYLPQEALLLNGTVRENIARFRKADMADVIAASRMAGVHELIGRLPKGYETVLTDSGGTLSGGQKQRIALARALFGNPRLLVLDEPNSSLDADGESALIEAVETARGRGVAVLIVAQRMSVLSRADRLIVLKDGAVAHMGDREAVLGSLSPVHSPRVGGTETRRLRDSGT